MESCVDAHSLISLSLLKIQRSRVQRGGIRLHRNLLVSGVLRSARQVYIREKYAELYRIQRYEEVMTVCDGIQELDPLHVDAEDAHGHEQARDGDCGDAPGHRGAATPAEHGRTPGCCASVLPGGKEPEPAEFRSCCMEPPPGAQGEHVPAENLRYCDRTTVLDLDTHVVTTVENGLLHGEDCGCVSAQGAPNPARKRRVEPEEPGDFAAGRKRLKPEEECPFSGSELSDSAHISNLISIFGSGFSGLLSRNQDLDLICSKQALASLGAWTRVIVAF